MGRPEEDALVYISRMEEAASAHTMGKPSTPPQWLEYEENPPRSRDATLLHPSSGANTFAVQLALRARNALRSETGGARCEAVFDTVIDRE